MVFGFIKSFFNSKTTQGANQQITHRIKENNGAVIPWHKGVVLIPLEPAIISIPEQVLSKNDIISSVIRCPNDAEISIDSDRHLIHLKIQAGMRVWLTKSCDAIVFSNNNSTSVEFEVEIPQEYQ